MAFDEPIYGKRIYTRTTKQKSNKYMWIDNFGARPDFEPTQRLLKMARPIAMSRWKQVNRRPMALQGRKAAVHGWSRQARATRLCQVIVEISKGVFRCAALRHHARAS